MAAIFEVLSDFFTITIFYFTMLILDLINLLCSITGNVSYNNRSITTTQYLKLIEEKNPASRYRIGVRVEPSECTVCLSMFKEGEEIRKLKCNHTFHKDCLDKWLQQDWATCPLCRRMVLPEEIVVKYHRRRRNQQEHYGSDEEFSSLLSALLGNNLDGLL